MKKTRRTTTTVEMHEVLVMRSSRTRRRFLCPECSEPVALVDLGDAMRIAGISSRVIYRLIEAGRVHFAETTETSLICPATLLSRTWKEQAHADGR